MSWFCAFGSDIYHLAAHYDFGFVIAKCGYGRWVEECSWEKRRKPGIRICKRCSPDLEETRQLLIKARNLSW